MEIEAMDREGVVVLRWVGRRKGGGGRELRGGRIVYLFSLHMVCLAGHYVDSSWNRSKRCSRSSGRSSSRLECSWKRRSSCLLDERDGPASLLPATSSFASGRWSMSDASIAASRSSCSHVSCTCERDWKWAFPRSIARSMRTR